MRHDELCEIGWWQRFHGPGYWAECSCAQRAYDKDPFEEHPVYSGTPLPYNEDDD